VIKRLAGQPLTIGVEGDELVIRIGVDTLAFAFETGEDNQPFDEKANDFRRTWKVVDKHDFAKGVAIALCDEEEDGSTPLTKILDEAYIRAVEDDAGVDKDGRIVTKEMLEYGGSEATEEKTEKKRSCNRHNDCDKADADVKAKGGFAASHCHDDECEDCFGC